MQALQQQITKIMRKPHWFLFCLGVAFFFLYSWLYSSTPQIFVSPDETATSVFTNHYRETGNFQIPFSPNPENIIRPRSVNISGEFFVPGGFLGLPLFLGALGQTIGSQIVLFLPALLAVVAILCLYQLWRSFFSERIALLSTIFAFFLPQWWHFSAKGFLPNVIFLSLCLIGAYGFVKAKSSLYSIQKRIGFVLSSGLLLGLALTIRPNELWWLLLIALVYVWNTYKHYSLTLISVFFIGFFFPFLVVSQLQSLTYGGLLSTGYDQLQQQAGGQISLFSRLGDTVFPFGVNLSMVVKTVGAFVFTLFWWQLIPFTIGLITWCKNPEKTSEQKKYTAVFLVISIYLFLYYGSWTITDDLNAERVSIGISYIRYWLPFFLGGIPFMILGLQWISARVAKKSKEVFFLLLSIILLGHILFVYEGDDGLRKIKQTIVEYNQIQVEVSERTEENAIIVGERIDKILWPKRQVIHFQDQDFTYVETLPIVLNDYPIYWMTLLPRDHISIWEETVFSANGLQVDYVEPLSGGYTLYQITYAQSS